MSESLNHPPSTARPPRVRIVAILLGIIAFHVAGSLWWIQHNVTLVGRDAAGHLERTVVAAAALDAPLLRAFFVALTLTDDYRPPLLYLLTVPFYQLFGHNMDAAQLVNVALLAVLLYLTFFLARRYLPDGWALLAVFITGLLPMIAAMTRLYYMENLLTVLLLVDMLAVLNSRAFVRRRWTLILGVSLGLTLLTKWTAPIYLLLPVLYILWRDWRGLPQRVFRSKKVYFFTPEQTSGLQQPTTFIQLRWVALLWRAALAIGLAALFVALWWWPSRDLADEFLLGQWLPLLWFALWLLTIFVLTLPAGRMTNLLSAGLLAASIASLWYFPQIDFTRHLSDVAFGTDRGTQEALDLTRLSNYTRYFGYWLSHHMGLLATVLIIPPAIGGWLSQVRSAERGVRSKESLVILWLMLLSAFLFLTLIAQANPRNLNALLPVIAILLVSSLHAYRRPLAIGLAGVWVTVLGVQWAIYTFDALAPLFQRTPQLWVQGDYLAWPATGLSDPGYWIQPDVLATIGNPRGDGPDDGAAVGMLIDDWNLHRGSFRYLVAEEQRNIEVMALTESDSRGWSDLLANQWVLLKTGDNSAVKPVGQALIARIRDGDPLFDLLYQEVKRYRLPNGEEAILYHRAGGSPHPDKYPVILIETAPIAETINRLWSAGATLYFGNPDTATWVGIHDLKADHIVMPAADAPAASVLDGISGTIFAVTRYDTAEVQDYLFRSGYNAVGMGDNEFHLTIVGRPATELTALPVQSSWDDVSITALRGLGILRPGEVLPVEVTASGMLDGSRKLSLRLVDPTGTVVAQQDQVVAATFRYGLLVPPDAPYGEYMLAAVLYDPATIQPIVDQQGEELAALTPIVVAAGP